MKVVLFLCLFSSAVAWSQTAFDDHSLDEILARNQTGIILTWSPFMPLSGLAKEELIEIAQEMGLDLQVIVDPMVQETSEMTLHSSVLIGRGMMNHFPSIALYKDGKLMPWMIQGYEQKLYLKKAIVQQLGQP